MGPYVLHGRNGHTAQSLSSIITFTGFIDASWAATSKDYVEKTWPGTETVTLSAIEKAVRLDQTGYCFDGDFAILELKRDATRSKFKDLNDELFKVAQQLAWMMSSRCTPEISRG